MTWIMMMGTGGRGGVACMLPRVMHFPAALSASRPPPQCLAFGLHSAPLGPPPPLRLSPLRLVYMVPPSSPPPLSLLPPPPPLPSPLPPSVFGLVPPSSPPHTYNSPSHPLCLGLHSAPPSPPPTPFTAPPTCVFVYMVRMRVQTSKPDMSGRLQSSSTSSGMFRQIRLMPASPLLASM